MRPSALAFALALSGCAAAPQAKHEYEVRTTVYEMPAELARSLTGTESNGGMPAPADLSERASAAASSRTDVQASSRPMIRVREGSTAEISNTSGTDYIQDYAVGADGKAQAVHATTEEGLVLELKPARRESGLEITYRVELSQLVQWTEE